MVVTEIDSFILKFKNLWKSGLSAHLDLDTHSGQAWVGLRVRLGHPLHRQVQQTGPKSRNTPCRQRPREKPLAARNEHAEKAVDPANEAEKAVDPSKEAAKSCR